MSGPTQERAVEQLPVLQRQLLVVVLLLLAAAGAAMMTGIWLAAIIVLTAAGVATHNLRLLHRLKQEVHAEVVLRSRAQERSQQRYYETCEALMKVLDEVVPAWRDTLLAGRGQMETAVTHIAERFESINEHFNRAVDAGDEGAFARKQAALTAVTASAQSAFDTLWQAMEAGARREQETCRTIERLAEENAVLVGHAAEVRHIAERINLLALNAAIEAARAAFCSVENGYVALGHCLSSKPREICQHGLSISHTKSTGQEHDGCSSKVSIIF